MCSGDVCIGNIGSTMYMYEKDCVHELILDVGEKKDVRTGL